MVIVLTAVEAMRDSADSGIASWFPGIEATSCTDLACVATGVYVQTRASGRRLRRRGRARRSGMQVTGALSRSSGRLPQQYLYEFHNKFREFAAVM